MPIYYLSNTNSDLSGGADFNKALVQVTAATNTIACSIAKSATETSYGFTAANKPNNADWETGGITVEVNVTVANSNIYLSVQADRINSAGTVQESSTATAEQQLSSTGVKTFNIASKDWSAGAVTDRLRIRYLFRNTDTKAASCTIQVGDANTEHTTSITSWSLPTCTSPNAVTTTTFGLTVRRAFGCTSSNSITTTTFTERTAVPISAQTDALTTTTISQSLIISVFCQSDTISTIINALDVASLTLITVQSDTLTTTSFELNITSSIETIISSVTTIINDLILAQSLSVQSDAVTSTSILLNSVQLFDLVSDSITTTTQDLITSKTLDVAIDILSTVLAALSVESGFEVQIDTISSILFTGPEIEYAIESQSDAVTTVTSAITTAGTQTLVLSGVQHLAHIDLSWVPV